MVSIESKAVVTSPARPWPADQFERWPIERLIPYANNPRLHSEADLEKIAAAIRKWGWTMPVLVDEHGVLLAGAARLGAATRLELKSIPVIRATDWSEEEKRAYRVADNQLAARASWDPDLLRDEIRLLEFADFDLGRINSKPSWPVWDRAVCRIPTASLRYPITRSLGGATYGYWEATGLAAATALARRMSRQCWRDRSLI